MEKSEVIRHAREMYDKPRNLIPSISLFITTPVSGTMTLDPKRVLTVVIVEIASPEWSATVICDVPGLDLSVQCCVRR